MDTASLPARLKPQKTIEKNGIFVSNEIADKTVWDTLAVENPTHAVISAKDEAAAQEKSINQLADIKQHLQEGDVLLDCGTGYGRVAKYLLPDMVLGGYIGVDSSYQMLSLFAQRYRLQDDEQRTPLLLLNADMYSLPLVDECVDAVLVSAVFLHNHKSIVEKAMTELRRVLKPGGKILVYSSFPRAATLMGVQGQLYQFLLNLLGRPFKNGPVRYYYKSEIQKLFTGFAEVELKPVGFGVLPKTIVGLPRPLEVAWRVGLANPINHFLEQIMPAALKPYFAVHFDVVAKR